MIAGSVPLHTATATAAGYAADYLAELQAEARTQQLAVDPQWLRLLHARPRRFGGVKSTIDFPEFFRAPDGRTNPRAELDATLAAFFTDTPIAYEPPQCRYKARYEWLRQRLRFDPSRLPPQACVMYDDWARALNAGSISIVFASNDLSNPSSMFGHTLLRVNAADQTGRERMLAYAVNYAAETSHDNGFAYALKGLGGEYRGFYSVMPYYDKIRQYEGSDHRDLWEYRLRLDPDQRQRLLWHLWELRGVWSDYYFFTENCSYQLLAMIETVRPDLDLTASFERFPPYAIPIDTVRSLRDAGLLDAPGYFPSAARQLQYRYDRLGSEQQAWVLAYGRGTVDLDDPVFTGAAPRDRARMLETEHDYLYLRFQEQELKRDIGLPRDRAVLLARSGIQEASDFPPLTQPETAPDAGHRSGRLSTGMRIDGDGAAAELRIRPAYHDRMDPAGGYLPGAEIEFLNLGALVREGGVTLADARLLSVQAVAPRSDTLHPLSWQIATGVRRYGVDRFDAGGHGALGEYIDGGPGLTWTPIPLMQVYVFALASIDANHDLPKDYAFQLGGRAGFATQPAPWLSTQLQADWMGDVAGGGRPTLELNADAQLHLGVRNGLRVGISYGDDRRRETTAVRTAWEHYF